MFFKKYKKEQLAKERKIAVTKFALGTAIGALAGILLAPKSGKEIREDFSDEVDEKKEKAKRIKDAAEKDIDKVAKDIKNSKTAKEIKK